MTRYIVIEGNIGAGKTSLAQRIADEYYARFIMERFSDNPFLLNFYNSPERYAFPVELSFLADRYNQLKNQITSPGLFSNFIISDYYFLKCLIFARVTLTDDEYHLYRKLFDIINRSIPRPDLYVYLHRDIEGLKTNIAKRGREYERGITSEYLKQLQDSYFEFFKQTDIPILLLDVTDADFVEYGTHYNKIKQLIFAQEYPKGITRIKVMP